MDRGHPLTGKSIQKLNKLLRWWRNQPRTQQKPQPPRHPVVSRGFPLRLAKPQTGETLDGSTPGTGALCDIYAGVPGSEVVVQEGITIYPGRILGSGNTIEDTDYFLCGEVNGVLQFVSPVAGGGGSGNMHMVLVELPSALTRAQSSKAGCTVMARFGDGSLPAVSSTITVTNPETTTGGTYFYAIPSGNHALVIGNGSTYWFLKPEPVLLDDPLTDFQVDGATYKLQKKTQDAYVDFVDTESGWTDIHTGTPCAE